MLHVKMASLVRVSRFAGNLFGTRRLLHNVCAKYHNVPILQNLPKLRRCNPFDVNLLRCCSTLPNAANPLSSRAQPVERFDALKSLEDQALNWGRVDDLDVKSALAAARKKDTLPEEEILWLIRSTGKMLTPWPPEKRRNLFEKVMSTVMEKGTPMNSVIFNNYLKTRMENNDNMDIVQVLKEAEETYNFSSPNRVTYQLMIAHYCEQGNLEQARKVLEHMSESGMSIGEKVFNSFIIGHLKNGDRQGADEVMEKMQEKGVSLTSETYCTWLTCFAAEGDLTALAQKLREADKEDIFITINKCMDVITTFVNSGHGDKLQDLLNILELKQRRTSFNNSLTSCCSQLLAAGHDEYAFDLYKVMHVSKSPSHYVRSFIREIVRADMPLEKILHYRSQLASSGYEIGFEELLKLTRHSESVDNSLGLLKEMEKEGSIIDADTILMILSIAKRSNNIEGYYKIAGRILEKPTLRSVTHLLFSLESLVKEPNDIDIIVERLKQNNLSDNLEPAVRLGLLMKHREYQDVIDYLNTLESESLIMEFSALKRLCDIGKVKPQNAEQFTDLLDAVKKCLKPKYYREVNSWMLAGTLAKCKRNNQHELMQEILDHCIEKKVELLSRSEEILNPILSNCDIADGTIEQLNMGTDKTQYDTTLTQHHIDLKTSTIEELETMHQKQPDHRYISRNLLLKYCYEGMTTEAETLKSNLEAQGVLSKPQVLRALGSLAATNGNLQQALQYKTRIEEEYPYTATHEQLVLHICQLRLKEGQYDEVISDLNNFAAINSDDRQTFKSLKPSVDLLKSCLDNQSPSQAQKLCEVLFEGKYVQPPSYALLNEVMSGYVKNDDWDAVLTFLEECVKNHNQTPLLDSAILPHLVETEDAVRLQKVIDICSSMGYNNILTRLGITFAQFGQINKAMKIFHTSGLRLRMEPLEFAMKRYVKDNKKTEAENLMNATCGVEGVDRDTMIFHVLRLYAKEDDTTKMMDMFTKYEEEGVSPSGRTRRYLANVLQNAKLPVPFEVPMTSTTKEDLEKAGAAGKLEEFINEMKEKGKLTKEYLQQYCGVWQTEETYYTEFLKVLQKLGDIDSVLVITEGFSEKKKSYRFAARILGNMYLDSADAEQYINKFIANPEAHEPEMNAQNLLHIVEKHPDSWPKVENAIKTLPTSRIQNILQMHLLNVYIAKGDSAAVEDFIKNQGELVQKVNVVWSLKMCINAGQHDLVKKTMLLLGEKNIRWNTYWRILDHYVYLEKSDLALEFYEDVVVKNMGKRPFVKSLEPLLKKEGKPVPWEEKPTTNLSESRSTDVDIEFVEKSSHSS